MNRSATNQMTIAKRVSLSSGFLCLVLAGVSLFAINRVIQLNKITDSIVGDSMPGLSNAGLINSGQAEAQILAFQLLLAKTPSERAALKEQIAAISKGVAGAEMKYQDAIFSEADRRNFELYRTQREAFLKNREQYYALLESNPEAAKKFCLEQLTPAYQKSSAAGAVLQDYNEQTANERGQRLAGEVKSDIWVYVIVGVCSLGIGIAAAVLVVRSINRALQQIASTLNNGASQVTSAAGELSGTSQSLAEGASQQAASLEETSASLEEISSMTRRNAENAVNGKSLGAQARQSADVGLQRIRELSATVGAINRAVGEMQSAVGEMQSSSAEIAKIIKTIDEIAFQTNLLALNAAVEAARAGEAGAGFAVVADEVRSLAQRSAQAAKDTSEKIEAAVKRSELGGAASAKVVQSLSEVEATAQNIEQVFSGIAGQIKSLDEVVAEIANASQEQSRGVNEVNMAVSQMDKVTQANAASAEENAASSEELNAQALTLQDVVSDLQAIVTGAQTTPAARPAGQPPRRSSTQPKFAKIPRTGSAASAHGNGLALPLPDPATAGGGSDGFTNF